MRSCNIILKWMTKNTSLISPSFIKIVSLTTQLHHLHLSSASIDVLSLEHKFEQKTKNLFVLTRSRSYSVPRSRANKTRPNKAPLRRSGSKNRGRPRAPVSPTSPVAGRRAAKGRPSDPRRPPPPTSRNRTQHTEVIELSPSPPSRLNPQQDNNRREKAKKKKDRKEKNKVQ